MTVAAACRVPLLPETRGRPAALRWEAMGSDWDVWKLPGALLKPELSIVKSESKLCHRPGRGVWGRPWICIDNRENEKCEASQIRWRAQQRACRGISPQGRAQGGSGWVAGVGGRAGSVMHASCEAATGQQQGERGGGMELRGYSFEPFVFYFCVARYFIRYYVSPRKLGIYIHTLCVLFVSSPVHYYPQARVSMGACGRAVPRQSARRRRPARGLGRAAPLVRG